jgi:hypothetical protein
VDANNFSKIDAGSFSLVEELTQQITPGGQSEACSPDTQQLARRTAHIRLPYKLVPMLTLRLVIARESGHPVTPWRRLEYGPRQSSGGDYWMPRLRGA